VTVADVRDKLNVRTVLGDVDFDSAVVAHTTIETDKGRLHVRLGPDSDARIEALTRTGLVRTDRLALIQAPANRHAARALLGRGEARMRLVARRGVIELTGPGRPGF
jgi:hypothetical protein